jgi:hypothetical protein
MDGADLGELKIWGTIGSLGLATGCDLGNCCLSRFLVMLLNL